MLRELLPFTRPNAFESHSIVGSSIITHRRERQPNRLITEVHDPESPPRRSCSRCTRPCRHRAQLSFLSLVEGKLGYLVLLNTISFRKSIPLSAHHESHDLSPKCFNAFTRQAFYLSLL